MTVFLPGGCMDDTTFVVEIKGLNVDRLNSSMVKVTESL